VNLVFLLEEPSAKHLLVGLLPRLVPRVPATYLVFEGKQDLEGQLVRKLRGWRAPDSAFVVLRDQDAAECRAVRAKLATLVGESRRAPSLVRVACRELESWIIGDWHAVAEAFDRPSLSKLSSKERYREPDALARPIDELRAHLPDYQKGDGARRVGGLLDPQRNQSRSFRTFCTGVQRLVGSSR
jgi:hypothetical protein